MREPPQTTLCSACFCLSENAPVKLSTWCYGFFLPGCLLGSAYKMHKSEKDSGPGQGCGVPCIIHSCLFFGIGSLLPALFASFVLADSDAACCEPDKGFCNICCQFEFCPPCAACKFYQNAHDEAVIQKEAANNEAPAKMLNMSRSRTKNN
jgi:hypothetical protein